MDINLVIEGLKFMVLGMVTVFVFLIILVIILKLQFKIINKLIPSSHTNAIKTKDNIAKDNTALVAVISAAITQFRLNSTKVKNG